MHTEETKNRFIELRALGLSYDKIAAETGVNKRTLMEWNREFADEIHDLRAAGRERLKEKLIGSREQWCARIVAHFDRLDREFGTRKLQYSPTESVFRMMLSARNEIMKELVADSPLDKPVAPDPEPPIPNDNP